MRCRQRGEVNLGSACAQARLPPDVAVGGDGAAVLRADDVEVGAHRAVADPPADVVADVGERPGLGGLGLREHRIAAVLALLGRVRVANAGASPDRRAGVLDGGERPVPELGCHPSGRVPDGALGGGLLLGLPGLGTA